MNFTAEVAKLAPDVPAKRLALLVRGLEDEGVDVAPELATAVLARRALERLKEIDPDSFKPKDPGNAPPVPGVGGMQQRGPIDYRERGARVAGRK